MQKWLREMALCFSAGGVGALAKTGAIWLCGYFSITSFASHLAGAQYPSGVYARIVWGGIFAFLFLLPVRGSWVERGLILGLVAAVLQVIAVPLMEHGNMHFALMPLLSVLALSCIWGLATAIALHLFGV